MVLHRHHPHRGIRRSEALHQPFQLGREAHPRGDHVATLPLRRRIVVKLLGFLHFADLPSEQAHSVFDLGEVLIPVLLRHFQPGDAEKLVAWESEGGAEGTAAFLLKGRDHFQKRPGFLPGKRPQREQPLPEFGQPHRHQRSRFGGGGQRAQVIQGAHQGFAVILLRADHDLTVEVDARFLQPGQPLHNIPGEAVVHQPAAQLRVGGVDADIQRRSVATDNPLELLIVHVGQGDEIAHHQGKPPVVVLHVQSLAQSRRHLGDKAEGAIIVAGARTQGHALPEMKPHGLHLVLSDGQMQGLSVPLQLHFQLAVGDQRLIVDLVDNVFPVDAQKHVAGENTGPVGRRTAVHRGDLMAHKVPPSAIPASTGRKGRCHYALFRSGSQERAASFA